jgi:hypothetical protein
MKTSRSKSFTSNPPPASMAAITSSSSLSRSPGTMNRPINQQIPVRGTVHQMQLQVELLTEQEMLAQAVEVKLQRVEPLPPHTNLGLILQLKLDVDGGWCREDLASFGP